MPWGVIDRSSVLVDVLDAEFGRIIRVRVPRLKVKRQSGDKPGFSELYRAAFRRKQAVYHRWMSLRTPANWVLF